jgi:hypothetical protein
MTSRRLGAAVAAACLTLSVAGATYATSTASASPAAPTAGSQLAKIRAATATYHDLATAQKAGWSGLFQDVNGLTCIADTDTPSMGGMGYHWVNPANIGSTEPTAPAALIYAPTGGGHVRLAGMEYLVPDPDQNISQPFLDGHGFMWTPPGNRFLGDTGFWSLHVWAWDHNPSGMYEMWNPKITCP